MKYGKSAIVSFTFILASWLATFSQGKQSQIFTPDVLSSILGTAKSVEFEPERSLCLCEISETLLYLGMKKEAELFLKEALKNVDEIEEEWFKAGVYGEIAKVMYLLDKKSQGDQLFRRALHIAKSIREKEYQAEALSEIAGSLGEAGKFDEALKIYRQIEGQGDCSWAMERIVKAMVKKGRYKEALSLTKKLYDYQKLEVLYELAKFLKGKDEMVLEKVLSEAIKTAKDEKTNLWNVSLLDDVADIMRLTGKEEELGKIYEEVIQSEKIYLEGIEDERDRDKYLKNIILQIAKVGNFADAFRLTRSIKEEAERYIVLVEIAEKQVEKGKTEEAVKLCKEVLDSADKVDPLKKWEIVGAVAIKLAEIADKQVGNGETKEVKKLCEEVLESAKEADLYEKGYIIGPVAVAMAKLGDLQKAIELAREITFASAKAETLYQIGDVLAEKGDINKAKELFKEALYVVRVGEMECGGLRPWLLGEIVKIMSKWETALITR